MFNNIISYKNMLAFSVVISAIYLFCSLFIPAYTELVTFLITIFYVYYLYRNVTRDYFLSQYDSFEEVTEEVYHTYLLESVLPRKMCRPSIYKVECDDTVDSINAKVGRDSNGWFIIIYESLLDEDIPAVNNILCHELGHILFHNNSYYRKYRVECMLLIISVALLVSFMYSLSLLFVLVIGFAMYCLDILFTQYEEVYCDMISNKYGMYDNVPGLHALKASNNHSRNRLLNSHPPVDNRIQYVNNNSSFKTISIKEILIDSFECDWYLYK